MNSNFEFLKKDWEILFKIGEMAEYTLYKDPNTALIKMRQLGEYLVKSILKIEKIYDERESNQKKKILRLREEDLITEKEASILNTLREIGNKAVHSAYDDKAQAEMLLPKVVELCSWFNELYGSDYQFDSNNVVYHKPQDIDYQKAYESLKKKYDEAQTAKEFSDISFENLNIKPKEERKKIYQKRKKKELTEAETRYIIDTQLREAGWEVDTQKLNYKINKTMPESKRYMAIAEWPCIKENGERGYVDYALFYEKTLIGVVEAKRFSVDIGGALRRDGEMYAKGIETISEDIRFHKNAPFKDGYKVQFIFSANGRDYNKEWIDKSGIWFLDAKKENSLPTAIHSFYSPEDLMEKTEKDEVLANKRLEEESVDYLTSKDGLNLRYYQLEAVQAVEKALINGQNKVLLTMATGTGKTRTALAILYRLLESQKYKRILFVVDRATLGEQAMDTFSNAKIKQQQPLTKIYEVLGLEEKTPNTDTKVHIATVQGLINRVMYSDTPLSVGKYDCIIIDEAHRGYTLDRTPNEDEAEFRDEKDYQSKYRYVIDYFEADKIALTATPALHTYEIFGEPVYEYSYRRAVLDGYLVDFQPKRRIYTELNTKGITYQKGDEVKVFDRDNQTIEKKILADEISFDIEDFNKKVIVESFNRVVCSELVKDIDPEGPGKTLIFASTDEHADMIVRLLEEEYIKADIPINGDMIKKITGSVKDVGKLISRYKNEQYPTIAVTVDLLTTGVDVPKITNLVFLRKVKSRILYEQMIGRATRKCDEIDKEYFTIYDPVGIYEDLESYTDMKPVVKNIDYKVKNLFKELEDSGDYEERKRYYADNIISRLQRKKKKIESKGETDFRTYSNLLRGQEVQNINEYLNILKDKLEKGKIEDIIKEKDFLIYLDQLKLGNHQQVVSDVEDKILEVAEDYGNNIQDPDDYLEGFRKFIIDNKEKIQALNILLTNPKLFTRKDLKTIKIILDDKDYRISNLQKAYSKRENKYDMTIDILTFINNAIKGSPIKKKSKKLEDIYEKVTGLYAWNGEQIKIIKKIIEILDKDEFITEEDFKQDKIRDRLGTYKRANTKLNGMLDEILEIIKEEIILN